jgi:hypothetical protein
MLELLCSVLVEGKTLPDSILGEAIELSERSILLLRDGKWSEVFRFDSGALWRSKQGPSVLMTVRSPLTIRGVGATDEALLVRADVGDKPTLASDEHGFRLELSTGGLALLSSDGSELLTHSLVGVKRYWATGDGQKLNQITVAEPRYFKLSEPFLPFSTTGALSRPSALAERVLI